MLDNQLFQLIKTVMTAGLTQLQLNNTVGLRQNYNAQQVGTPTGPTLFVYKIGDHRRGTPRNFSKWSHGAAVFTASVSGNVMTVTHLASGEILPYQTLVGAGIPSGVVVQAFGTGSGGVGTYILNQQLTVLSESITSAAVEVTIQEQAYETTFQVSGLSTQDPANPNQLTASDIVNYASAIMQSGTTVASIEAQGVGVLKVSDIRNPYFSDDRVRYEASPSFDFTLTHKQTIITAPPILSGETLNIYSV